MNKSFSKLIAIVNIVLFIFTLITSFGIMIYLSINNLGETVDYALCISAIGVVAGLLGLTMRSYYSKAGLENVAQIRKSVYREVMDVRLEYDQKVLELRQQYGVSQEEIDEIEDNGPFKEMSENVLGQTTNKLDEVDTLNEAEPEVESYG